MHSVEEALHERSPLQREGCNQEVEAYAAEAVALQEGHEEAKTDEDHHVHILETCTTERTPAENMEFHVFLFHVVKRQNGPRRQKDREYVDQNMK